MPTLENLPSPSNFLRQKLFGNTFTTEADQIDARTYLGNNKVAPYCSRFSKGHAVARAPEQLMLLSPPFIKVVRSLTSDDVFYRSSPSNENRDAQLLARDLVELSNQIGQREEWACAQTLFTGGWIARDGDSNEIVAEISYGTPNVTVPAVLWSVPATAKPLDDIKSAQRLVAGNCGFAADTIVFGKDAGDAFENANQVLVAYDKQNISPGVLTPELAEFGVTLLGQYRGVSLYVSETQFTDLDGSKKYYVPPDTVLVAASGVQGTLSFAGVVQVDNDETRMEALEGTRIPLVWYEKGEDYRKLRLSSRPAPVPAAGVTSWTLLKPV
jgi:hypothetical protein